MSAEFVKVGPGFRIVGSRNADNDYEATCTCGRYRIGGDYWNMRAWISSHAAQHMLRSVV